MLVFLDACCGVRRDSPYQSQHFRCVHFLEKRTAFDCSSFLKKILLSGNQSGSPPVVRYTILYCEMVRGSSTARILFVNQMSRWRPWHHCMLSFVDVQSGSPHCVTVLLLLYLIVSGCRPCVLHSHYFSTLQHRTYMLLSGKYTFL